MTLVSKWDSRMGERLSKPNKDFLHKHYKVSSKADNFSSKCFGALTENRKVVYGGVTNRYWKNCVEAHSREYWIGNNAED